MATQIQGYALCSISLIPAFLEHVATGSEKKQQKIIGETICKYRRKARLTQEKLAEKADLHPVYIGELERGEESASVAALVRIAKALKIQASKLLADL